MSASTSTMAQPLAAGLKRDAPSLGLERIVSVDRFASGLSSQSYCVEAETTSGPARWVMRIEPEFGVIPPYDIAREYRLLQEMHGAGKPMRCATAHRAADYVACCLVTGTARIQRHRSIFTRTTVLVPPCDRQSLRTNGS